MWTTRGSPIFRNLVPSADALPVERILGAGAVTLGKTNCPEFGLIGDTTNRLGDRAATPGVPSGPSPTAGIVNRVQPERGSQ